MTNAGPKKTVFQDGGNPLKGENSTAKFGPGTAAGAPTVGNCEPSPYSGGGK